MKLTILLLFSACIVSEVYAAGPAYPDSTRYSHKDLLPDSIDMSKDLTTLGIASKNLAPGDNSNDAGIALEAAVKYATANKINLISLKQGDYFFLTVRNTAHLTINQATSLTINGNGANFIFNNRKAKGIIVTNSNNVGLENFTVDYQNDPPFTTAVISSVDAGSKTISFAVKEGARPATDLNNVGKSSVKIFILRAGPSGFTSVTSRMVVSKGAIQNNSSITVDENDTKNLDKIHSGDLLCLTERSYDGNNAISFVSGPPNISSGNFAKNLTILSSPAIGLSALWQKNIQFSNIVIQPKKGREQYISSNADGINITNGGSANHVTNCSISSTGDDGISFATTLLGNVVSADNSAIVAELRYFVVKGQTISFSSSEDLGELGSPVVTDISPIANQTPGKLKQFNIGLNAPVPGLVAGTPIYLAENDRSQGTTIENNNISNSFSRGIFFAGVTGTMITGNTITSSMSSGILGQCANEKGGFKSPQSANTTIENNTVVNAFRGGFTQQKGGIEFSISTGGQKATTINSGLTIRNNKVSVAMDNGNHVGIFISNSKNTETTGNQIMGSRADGRTLAMPNESGIQKVN